GVRKLVEGTLRLSRGRKKVVMVVADGLMIPVALFLAISVRLGEFGHLGRTGLWPYAAALATTLPIFVRLGLYRAVVRYVGGKAIRTVVAGVTLSTALLL